jgi:hypothetical protein
VITTRRLRGSSTEMFFRLCVRAPRMRIESKVAAEKEKLATIARRVFPPHPAFVP